MKTFKRKLIPEIEQQDLMFHLLSNLSDKGIWIDFQRIKPKRKDDIRLLLFSQCESILTMTKERITELFPEKTILCLPCAEGVLDDNRISILKGKYQEHITARFLCLEKQEEKKKKREKSQKNKEEDQNGKAIIRPHVRVLLKDVSPEVEEYLNLTLKYSSEIYERYFDMIKDAYVKSCQTNIKDVARTWLRPFGTLNRDLHRFKELNPKYYNVDSTALQNAIRKADDEWAAFFRNCYKENKKPRKRLAEVYDLAPEEIFKVLPFPGKKPFDEFMVTSSTLSFDGEKIKIPKISKPICASVIFSSYKGEGKITSATFKKDINNNWLASFLYKIEKAPSSSDKPTENP